MGTDWPVKSHYRLVTPANSRSRLKGLPPGSGDGWCRANFDRAVALSQSAHSRLRQAFATGLLPQPMPVGSDYFSGPACGSVKLKVLPLPGMLSDQMRPPARSRIRLQIANPSPVPGRLFCSRLNKLKIYSAYR